MKEKIINVLKLAFCFILFLYIGDIFRFILITFNIDTSKLSFVSRSFLELIMAIIMTFFTCMIYYKDLKHDFKEFKVNMKNKILFSLKVFGIMFLFKVFSSYLADVLAGMMGVEITTSENQSLINDMFYEFTLLICLSATILAPLYEETIFRLGFKKCISNRVLFVLVSGCLFGFIHIFPTDLNIKLALLQSISYVSMGLCLAYFYQKFNNIFYSIMLHFFNNFFSVIVMLLLSIFNLI